jgi:hypothetical protein
VRVLALSALSNDTNGAPPMSQAFEASRSLTALEQDTTIIAVIEIWGLTAQRGQARGHHAMNAEMRLQGPELSHFCWYWS